MKCQLTFVTVPNAPKAPRRKGLASVDTIVFHRIHVGNPETDDGATIAKYFEDHGAEMPYAFIIPKDQPDKSIILVEQLFPLWVKSPHAANWNGRSVGIGVVGDFRKERPTKKQEQACLWIARRIIDACEPHMRDRQWRPVKDKDFLITVHGALTTGTADPDKLIGGPEECPGAKFRPFWRRLKKAIHESGKLSV